MLEKKQITFDEASHTYVDENKADYISATTLLGTCEEEFPTEFWSVYRQVDRVGIYSPAPKPEMESISVIHDGRRKLYHIDMIKAGVLPGVLSNKHVKKEWKDTTIESCEWGTDKHNYLENCIKQFYDNENTSNEEYRSIDFNKTINGTNCNYRFSVISIEELNNSPLKSSDPEVHRILVALITKGYTLYAELRVYDPVYFVAGTIDVCAIRGKEFVIVDWKTNKKPLKFVPGYYKKQWSDDRSFKYETDVWVDKEQRLKYPLNDLMVSKGMMYTLQLSLYAYIMERWGFKLKSLVLCHIRPMLDEFKRIKYNNEGNRIELPAEIYFIDYKKGAIERLFDFRLKQIKAKH